MIDRNHPAVEAARRALANDDENGCMIEQHEGNGMWTCLAHGMSADGPEMCWYVRDMPVIALNAALPHLTAVDNHPWDPLVRHHPLNVGDEVRQDHLGVTYTGVVARVDKHGDPWTAEGGLIGLLRNGTWWVRHAAQELPTEDGAVIVPAEGFEFIWAGGGRYFDRLTYSSRTRRWYGVIANGGAAWAAFWYGDPETITPGTWKVDNR